MDLVRAYYDKLNKLLKAQFSSNIKLKEKDKIRVLVTKKGELIEVKIVSIKASK